MKIQPILSSILALTLLGACKSPTTIVENDIGIMQGKVALFANCNSVSDASGVTVSIEGTAFSATTNTQGDWTINNVPAGIYNILITKPGFDTDLIAQDQFSGAGTQFLENGGIRSESPLLDSVLISSIQITKKDSIQHWDSVISLGNGTYDTIPYHFDTVGYEYFLNITFTMQGPDSSISFEARLTDVTHTTYEYVTNEGYLQTQPISRSGSFVSHAGWITATGSNGQGYPQPGDSMVVKTIPLSSCEGRKVDTLSKGFVLP